MYCRNCGAEMNRDGRCPVCGYEYQDQENQDMRKPAKKKKHVLRKLILGILAIYLVGGIINFLPHLTEAKKTIETVRQITAVTPAPAAAPVAATPKPKPQPTPAPVKQSGIRPEFKNAMESYESFFDEYVAFMERFSSDPNNMTSMMSEYMTFMSKYAKAMEDLEKVDQSKLSPEEQTLYIQTMLHIQEKLLTAASVY